MRYINLHFTYLRSYLALRAVARKNDLF